MITQFFIPGLPVAQPRAKAAAFAGRARVYTPKTAEVWKAAIVLLARERIRTAMTGPVRCRMDFTLPRPRSHYGTGRNATVLKAGALEWCGKKPDLDNLAKAVMDALTNAGAWSDDAQVCDLRLLKRFGEAAETGVNLTMGTI